MEDHRFWATYLKATHHLLRHHLEGPSHNRRHLHPHLVGATLDLRLRLEEPSLKRHLIHHRLDRQGLPRLHHSPTASLGVPLRLDRRKHLDPKAALKRKLGSKKKLVLQSKRCWPKNPKQQVIPNPLVLFLGRNRHLMDKEDRWRHLQESQAMLNHPGCHRHELQPGEVLELPSQARDHHQMMEMPQ